MSKYVTTQECEQCRIAGQAKRDLIVEKINGLDSRMKILLGTNTVTIVLLAIELISRIP